MVKVFNASNPPRRFLLSGVNGGTMDVRPGKFYDVPDEFTGDITYKSALACGDLKVFESTAEGESLEKAAAEGEKPKTRRGRGASLLSEEE